MKRFLVFFCILSWTASLHAKPLELIFWHSMAGSLGSEVKFLTKAFNQSQNEFLIKPMYKGDYIETFTSFAAAFRAQKPPALVQIFEVGTALMLSPKGIIKPLDDLMAENAHSFDKKAIIKSVSDFYSQDGKLMAMPFNLSIPVVYYNQDLLEHLGYTAFPSTWQAMEVLNKKIREAGYECSYTTAYPGWIFIESYLAVHNFALIQANPLKSTFDTPALLKHFNRLKRWQKLAYFKYGGRVDDATALFTAGICPIFSQSSGAYNSLSSLTPFTLGVALLPLDPEVSPVRHTNLTGGAALWAVSGLSKKQYQGIAAFFEFIAKPEIQQHWHEHTGYLPILSQLYQSNAKTKHPILSLAKQDLEGKASSFKPNNLGPLNQIRAVNDEVLEAMFAGLMPAKIALQESKMRVNQLLRRFLKNTQN